MTDSAEVVIIVLATMQMAALIIIAWAVNELRKHDRNAAYLVSAVLGYDKLRTEAVEDRERAQRALAEQYVILSSQQPISKTEAA